MRSHTTQLLLVLIPLCLLSSLSAGRADTRDKAGDLSFAIPQSWTCEPSKTGPGVAIMSPTTHKVGPILRKDVFIARTLPSQGHSLEELKHNIETATLAEIKKMAPELKQRAGSRVNVEPTKDFSIQSKKIMIGKVSAYELTVHNVLLIEGQPVKMKGRTIIAALGKNYYIVSAGYEEDRDKVMKPISDAFLASLRFDQGK